MVYKSCEMVPLDLIYFNYCTSSCNIIMSYPSSVQSQNSDSQFYEAGAGANIFGSATLYPGKGLKNKLTVIIAFFHNAPWQVTAGIWPAKLNTSVVCVWNIIMFTALSVLKKRERAHTTVNNKKW